MQLTLPLFVPPLVEVVDELLLEDEPPPAPQATRATGDRPQIKTNTKFFNFNIPFLPIRFKAISNIMEIHDIILN